MTSTQKEPKTDSFRLLLQQELIDRCRRNPKYSLRAFAKSLGVVPSALSDMLNGKRTITAASIQKLGLAIGLKPSEIKRHIKSPELNKGRLFQQLTLDTYAIISDWYHYAILELMKTQSFKNDLNWIVKTLGISKNEANAAFERLCRAGLLEISKNGDWIDRTDGFSTNIIDSYLTSTANKILQKQVLEMSLQALESLPPTVRNHTSMTMPINPKRLPEAIEKIKEFRRGLCELLEDDDNLTQVYQLAVSFYPLSKNTN